MDRVKNRTYRFLDHTADAMFEAFGRSLEEAFRNAAFAVISLMWDRKAVRPAEEVLFHISGRDKAQLLAKFLEEILYLLDTRMFLIHRIEVEKIAAGGDSCEMEGRFIGERKREHKIYGEVKAVTYDQMRIEEGKRFRVQVVVDM